MKFEVSIFKRRQVNGFSYNNFQLYESISKTVVQNELWKRNIEQKSRHYKLKNIDIRQKLYCAKNL